MPADYPLLSKALGCAVAQLRGFLRGFFDRAAFTAGLADHALAPAARALLIDSFAWVQLMKIFRAELGDSLQFLCAEQSHDVVFPFNEAQTPEFLDRPIHVHY
jgi:hypothetical protein